MGGTTLHANTATGALGIVDDRQIVHHRNGALRAVLFALLTGNTSIGTDLAGDCALLLIAADHCSGRRLGHQGDNLLGAGFYANSATDAFSCIYTGDTVLYTDSVYRAGSCTVTESRTAETAGIWTCLEHRSRKTGIYTLIYRLCACSLAVAVAMNIGILLDNVLCRNT